MKIAFSGSSGSGKTTLVLFLTQIMGLQHISGSAGDVKKEGDKMLIDDLLGYPGGGHHGVIAFSALNSTYGVMNQKLLQMRRREIIMENTDFVTDRSPIDNLTYFINQCAYHPEVSDAMVEEFAKDCLTAFNELDYMIYIRAVQPKEVERNGSRIANSWYQKSVDAQFEYWLKNYFIPNSIDGPQVLIIDYWDFEKRKKELCEFVGIEYTEEIQNYVMQKPE